MCSCTRTLSEPPPTRALVCTATCVCSNIPCRYVGPCLVAGPAVLNRLTIQNYTPRGTQRLLPQPFAHSRLTNNQCCSQNIFSETLTNIWNTQRCNLRFCAGLSQRSGGKPPQVVTSGVMMQTLKPRCISLPTAARLASFPTSWTTLKYGHHLRAASHAASRRGKTSPTPVHTLRACPHYSASLVAWMECEPGTNRTPPSKPPRTPPASR